MYQKRRETIAATKRCLTDLGKKLEEANNFDLSMISDVSENSVENTNTSLGGAEKGGKQLSDSQAKENGSNAPVTPAKVDVSVGTQDDVFEIDQYDNRSKTPVRSYRSVHTTTSTPLPSRRISFSPNVEFHSSPLRNSASCTSPAGDRFPSVFESLWSNRYQGSCDGGYHRAEAEFLRGPKDQEVKFGDGQDNYHLWAESFDHSLSLLPNLSGINKLHALVSHTKGYARDTVLLYKNSARHDTAEKLFCQAWDLLRVKYGSDDTLADVLDAKVVAFEPLRYPLELDQLSSFKALCECVHTSLHGGDVRDKILMKYNEKDGLHILAEKLPQEYLEHWLDEVLDYKRSNDELDPDLLAFLGFLNWMFKKVSDPFLRTLNTAKSHSSPSGGCKRVCSTTVSSRPQNSDGSSSGNGGHNGRAFCPLHKERGHWIAACDILKAADPDTKRDLLLQNYACLHCTLPHPHWKCEAKVTCGKCKGKHLTLVHELHVTNADSSPEQGRAAGLS